MTHTTTLLATAAGALLGNLLAVLILALARPRRTRYPYPLSPRHFQPDRYLQAVRRATEGTPGTLPHPPAPGPREEGR